MDDVSTAIQAHGLKRKEQIISNFESKNISGKILEKAKISELKKAEEGEGGDHWITINGRHILISGAGEVKQGGKGMADGKDIKKIGGKGKTFGHLRYKSPEARKERAKEKRRADYSGKLEREEYLKRRGPESEESKQKRYAKNKLLIEQHKKQQKPSKKKLAATEFEETYSKKEAKKYAEGGVPTSKKKKENWHSSGFMVPPGRKSEQLPNK